MKTTKSIMDEFEKLINSKYDVTLYLVGGHEISVKITKIENSIVYFDLSIANQYQKFKGWSHISDISGVSYRET